MGLEFGNLPVRIRRVIYYTLSSRQQRVWAKSVSHGVPNLMKRAISVIPSMTPAIIVTTWTYVWGLAAYEKSKRKDPKLYENDK